MTDNTDDNDQRDADDNDQNENDRTQDTEELKSAGREALRRERAARKAAEKDATEARQKLDAIEAERKKKADADAVEQGKYKELLETREHDLEAVTGERDALKGEREALTTYFDTQYAAETANLPDVVKAFAPAEDASFIVKAEWLTKAQEQAKKIAKEIPRGNGPGPRSRGNSDEIDEQAAFAQARRQIRI